MSIDPGESDSARVPGNADSPVELTSTATTADHAAERAEVLAGADPRMERATTSRKLAPAAAAETEVPKRSAARTRSLSLGPGPQTASPDERVDAPRDTPATSGNDAVAHAPDTTYYTTRQVDIFPALVEPLRLDYPARAVADNVRGRALVELQISEAGIVHAVAVLHADPSGYFEDEVRATFLASRFTPALRDGRPVRSRVQVRVDFGAESTPR